LRPRLQEEECAEEAVYAAEAWRLVGERPAHARARAERAAAGGVGRSREEEVAAGTLAALCDGCLAGSAGDAVRAARWGRRAQAVMSRGGEL